MKATLLDYLLSTLVICALCLASAGLVFMVSPLTLSYFNSYHVLADTAGFLLAFGLCSATFLRLLLKLWPPQIGKIPPDTLQFTYWKLLTVVCKFGQGALRPMVPFFLTPILSSIFGARIGKDVAFGGAVDDPYLVEIGNAVILGNASLITGNFIQGGVITCGRVVIGNNVTVGANSVVYPDTVIGDNATLMVGTVLVPGSDVKPNEVWRGNPGRKWQ